MVSIKLYVEGGGDTRDLKSACREGFKTFIEKAGLSGMMPRIVACGGRDKAYDKFKIAHVNQEEISLLLVDAERPFRQSGSWRHLQEAPDEWSRPDGATDDQCHLMVEIMESWFLADREALKEFYGQGYRGNALPQNPRIERIAKQDVLDKLDRAARDTSKRGYHKGSQSFEILAKLDPEKVKKVSLHAKRFIEALFKLGQS